MPPKVKHTLAEFETVLTELDPNEILIEETGLQGRKSAQTRLALLDATIVCLAKIGYTQTSTQLVAQTAKVSRGAMLHHYPTKLDLISATIDHIEIKRLRQFHREVKKLTERQRIEQGYGLEIYWRILNTKESDAFLELSVASRTDRTLQGIFDKKVARYDELRLDVLPSVFPEWEGTSREDLQLARDMITATLTGLRVNHRIMKKRSRRVALRHFLFESILTLKSNND